MGASSRVSDAAAVTAAGRQWVRRAMANCYFHSPMPAVVSRLRREYQVDRSENGNLNLTKRDRATARILYYHRVNDENDPFCPAISTALFEAEMRFLRRCHRVVSLDELMRRLSDGPADPVLAITFDDGYQDNYKNAFPILQRYGLPATIFLTTGSMDTDEGLWFERLAVALRNTSRESLDLEAVHFSLRTETERLSANAEIFSMLRQISNGDRLRLLNDILKQLSVSDVRDRCSSMLTWDEVRAMSVHGITFGGHTVAHPFLSRLSSDQFRWEVSECKRRIEDELQRAADYFAYPNGREEDFGSANKQLIREAGYRAAVTTMWGVNDRSTDPFELRRGGPWEESAAVFAYKLDWYELTQR